MYRKLSNWIVLAVVLSIGCAPVLPHRSRQGGAARWALAMSRQNSVEWQRDAQPCRVQGLGVGEAGWLPDRGGAWIITFWSASAAEVLEVTVHSDGHVTKKPLADSPFRGKTLPVDWADSPRIWAAAKAHVDGIIFSTLESELAFSISKEFPPQEQALWRIRFFMKPKGFETHLVTYDGNWLSHPPETETDPQ